MTEVRCVRKGEKYGYCFVVPEVGKREAIRVAKGRLDILFRNGLKKKPRGFTFTIIK